MRNKNLSIREMTSTVVNVQKQALDLNDGDIHSGVNIYARNAVKLLQSFGINKERLHVLINEVYSSDIQQIDDSLGDVSIGVMTLSHMLSSDLQIVVYQRLCEMINTPNEYLYRNTDVTLKQA